MSHAHSIGILQAAGEGDTKQLAALLAAGRDPNAVNPVAGNTPLYNAAITDHVAAVRILLRHGADVNQRFTYRSPIDGRVEADVVALHYALTPQVAKLLIDAGTDVDVADARGGTALMHRAYSGQADTVRSLLGAGADPRIRQLGRGGRTAREFAEHKVRFWKFIASAKDTPPLGRRRAMARARTYGTIVRLLQDAEQRRCLKKRTRRKGGSPRRCSD